MTTAVLRAMTIPAATLAAAISLGGLFATPAARASEFCSIDTDFMTDCSFGSIEQCQASRSGRGGECFLRPSSKDNSIATINRNAYAYSPPPSYRAHIGRSPIAKTNR